MLIIRASMQEGRVLRRTWYLTEGPQSELRSRWSIESPLRSDDQYHIGLNRAGNRPVTKACDTNTMTACA